MTVARGSSRESGASRSRIAREAPPLRLKAGSPAIDVGNHSFNSQPLDLGQQPHIQGLAIDMGAFEATPAPQLAMHKRTSSATVKVGEVVTYTFEVINTGAITLTALSATDDKLGAVNLGRLVEKLADPAWPPCPTPPTASWAITGSASQRSPANSWLHRSSRWTQPARRRCACHG